MTFEPVIRNQSDLETAWRTLMGPLGFTRHSLWLMMIGADGSPVRQLTKLDDDGRPLTPQEKAGLADTLRMLETEFVPGGSIVFLRSRPGAGGITTEDRAWAATLYDVGRLSGVPVGVVHRACDVDLVPVPMDEVLPASA